MIKTIRADESAYKIVKDYRDLLKSRGQNASFADAIRYMDSLIKKGD